MKKPTLEAVQSVPAIARWMPAVGWLRSYERAWFRGDVVAGVTLAAYLLPAAIGGVSLAGLPPEAGLYACLFKPAPPPNESREWT